MMSYEQLGRVSAARELDVYGPDLIIADECHRLKNKHAGVTKRVRRYMDARPQTKFIAVSGTVMSKSIKDFAHILAWTHKQDAPVPLSAEVVEEWASAIDEVKNPLNRRDPGALLQLGDSDGADSPLVGARQLFRHRLVDTPGVVASPETQDYTGSLLIRGLDYSVNRTTEKNFETLRTLWETPDGWALTEAVAVWRHARELALGLHYVWNPRPPDEWLAARRAWAGFVREYLSRSRRLDTELQVTNAVLAEDVDDGGLLAAWQTVQPTFTVNPEPVWHDDSALEVCEKWLKDNEGICWVEHTFFADELSRRTGLPYYGAGGLDATGKTIEEARGSVIASIAANGTGRNLQRWGTNLLTTVPGSQALEQLLGRTHRDGQQADEVTADVLVGCVEHVDAMNRALQMAHMQRDTLGQVQKLLLADMTYPIDVKDRIGFRWSKPKGMK